MTVIPASLPARPIDGHKGTFGRVLIVAGSRDMPGAAVLATLAALRSGAGLATLASTRTALDRAAPNIPCATLFEVPGNTSGHISKDAASQLVERSKAADVMVIGPGLGIDEDIRELVAALLADIRAPIVLDADGLNAIAGTGALEARQSRMILTPHPGEMSRLMETKTPTDDVGRSECALAAARRFGACVILKGARTVVTDGEAVFVNETGNPGMATGGSGDVLSGVCAALVAQGMDLFPAAIAAVNVHGLAGDHAAEARSEESLIASDLLESLGAAFRTYRSQHPGKP